MNEELTDTNAVINVSYPNFLEKNIDSRQITNQSDNFSFKETQNYSYQNVIQQN